MELGQLEQKFLKKLFVLRTGIGAYELYREFKVSPLLIISVIDKLKEMGFMSRVEGKDKYKLTKKGIKWVEKNIDTLFLTPPPKFWKELPEQMLVEPQFGLYLPDEKLMY